MNELEMSEQSCYTCGKQLTLMEVACGDGNCVDCFEKQMTGELKSC